MKFIGFFVVCFGVVIATIAGFFLGNISTPSMSLTTAVCLTTIWFALYIFLGLRIVKQKEFLVIERLGKFYRVAHRGPRILCLPGVIDKIAMKNDLKLKRLDLYKDEPENKIDYKDGSARTLIQTWYRISNSDFNEKDDREKIDEDIVKFIYNVKNPEGRIEEILDALARPELQEMTIDEANVKKSEVAKKILKEATESGDTKITLENIGVTIDPKKGVLITDIELPDSITKLRELKLEGQKEAERSAARGGGYAKTINAIITEAKKNDINITFKEAWEIYERQRGLETVGSTGANITFITPDIKGIMKTLDITPKKGGGK